MQKYKELILKNLRLVLIAIILIAVVLVAVLAHRDNHIVNSACGPYRNDKTVQIGSTKIAAEVVSKPEDQAKGLSGRPCIEPNQGMLFVYSTADHYQFWMKDMKFPIDIIWIGSDHKVVAFKENISPSTYPDRFVNQDTFARSVLELKANSVTRLHIGWGTAINFQ